MAIDKDLKQVTQSIVIALSSSGYMCDYSIDSLKEVDRFILEQKDGILKKNTGKLLFALGGYVGETIKKELHGEWCFPNEEDEINISLITSKGIIFPIQRVIKCYQEPENNLIYSYAISLQQ